MNTFLGCQFVASKVYLTAKQGVLLPVFMPNIAKKPVGTEIENRKTSILIINLPTIKISKIQHEKNYRH
ncbi:hypothetical protein BVG80_09805 [Sphingobacteriales bacterium TSM_CSM]|nr:hypothetical protein BVG80_09805 [Sphingobacteriales bacterium TSM_CSM]